MHSEVSMELVSLGNGGHKEDLRDSELPVGDTGAAGMDRSLKGCLLFLQDHLSQLLLDHTAGYSTCRGRERGRLLMGG